MNLKPGAPFQLYIRNSSTTNDIITFIGQVPDKNSVKFTLNYSENNSWNMISIPLDEITINSASALASDISGVDQIVKWDYSTQQYSIYLPNGNNIEGIPNFLSNQSNTLSYSDFPLKTGDVVWVQVNSLAPSQWPN